MKGKDISASLFSFRPTHTLLRLSFTQLLVSQPATGEGCCFLFPPSQNTARLVLLSEETAINIGVATGLLAAEQGKAERPMSLRPEVF